MAKRFHVTQLAAGLGREPGSVVLSPIGYAQLLHSGIKHTLEREEELDAAPPVPNDGAVEGPAPIIDLGPPSDAPDSPNKITE